ncbi:MAG: OmpL47-type beta-barrel domain-containing protein, partial [Tumebacillaceae bacterium]
GDYAYEVHSYSDRYGESSDGSNVALTLVFPTMQAPLNFTQTIANGNDITLRWNAATYATAYKVYLISNGQKVLKSTVTGTSVSYTNQPAGDYTFEVHAYSDRFGESPAGSTDSFTLTWPTLVAPALKGTIANANNLTLNWTAATWANEYRVYEVTNGTRTQVYKGTALTTQLFNLTQATHTYELTIYNTRFGESAPSDDLVEPIVYPVMQAPVATAKVTGAASAQISWNFVTYANGYNVYELVNGQPVSVVKNLNNLSYTLNNLPYADHQYYVTSVSNSFGESVPSNTVIAKLITDTTAPVTTATAPSTWTNQSTAVTLSATDNDTGVAHTYYSLNDSAFAEGTSLNVTAEGVNKVSFYSVDKVGNTEATKIIYVKIDKTAPVTHASDIPAWSNQAATINLTATDDRSGVNKTYYSINGAPFVEGTTVTVDKEGVNTISFYSVDQAGNSETAQSVVVKSDRTAPVTASDAPATWSATDVTVHLTATDAQSGVAKTYYSINGSAFLEGTTFTVTQAGTNQVSFYSVDQAGNSETAHTVAVKIDKTAPVTTADASASWSKGNVTVKLAATDAESGVAKTYYSINGSAYVEGTSLTVDQAGTNQVSFYSVDAMGNTEDAKTITVKIDGTAPVTTASEVPTSWTKEDVTVNLTATDAQSGVAHTYYSVNGSTYVEGTTVTVDKAGVNEISFYSVDQAGNEEQAQTVTVKIDGTAPVTTSTEAPTTWTKDSITLNLTATDEQSGVANTYYSINGSTYVAGTTVTVDKEGVNTITFYSVDQAGNAEQAQTITVQLDGTAPVTTASDVPSTWTKDGVTVNLSATDTASGVANTYYSINGSAYVAGNTFTVDQAGTNQVSYYSIDQAGNAEQAQTLTVKIDRTAPVTTSDAKTAWTKGSMTVNLTSTDEQSGVAKTYYSIDGADFVEGTTITVTNEGIHTIKFYSTDAAGNSESAQTVQVKLDGTAPATTASDVPSAWAQNGVTVNLSATDAASGVANTYYSINGSAYVAGNTFT